MNLGTLTCIVAQWTDDTYVFSIAFDEAQSYRGYYDEVSFEPSTGVSVGQIKQQIERAFNETFTGYKGGEYQYSADTPVHLSYYGNASDPDGEHFEALVDQMNDEYLRTKSVD